MGCSVPWGSYSNACGSWGHRDQHRWSAGVEHHEQDAQCRGRTAPKNLSGVLLLVERGPYVTVLVPAFLCPVFHTMVTTDLVSEVRAPCGSKFMTANLQSDIGDTDVGFPTDAGGSWLQQVAATAAVCSAALREGLKHFVSVAVHVFSQFFDKMELTCVWTCLKFSLPLHTTP